jgi:hypothetical protein
MSLLGLCGVLQCLIVAAAVGRGLLVLLGFFLSFRRFARRTVDLRREVDALHREAEWAVAGLPDYPAGPPDGLLAQLEAQMPREPLSVEELYRIASEGLDKRPSKLPSDGEGKIR